MKIEKMTIKDQQYNDMKVVYSHKSMETLLSWMESDHSKLLEFGFMGTVNKQGNTYIIEDFYLMRNTITKQAYWESDEKATTDFFMSFPIAERRKIRCFAHSHVNMQTTPSGVDNVQMQDILDDMVSDYMIQLIVNRAGKNTVHIFDKEKGLIFRNPAQYIQLEGGELVEYISLTDCTYVLDKIPDGNYEIINGNLQVNENMTYNVIDCSCSIGVGKYKIAYDDGKLISWIKTLDKESKQTLVDNVNALFKENMPEINYFKESIPTPGIKYLSSPNIVAKPNYKKEEDEKDFYEFIKDMYKEEYGKFD